jgi:ABC transport system ATP-binding/permease protein
MILIDAARLAATRPDRPLFIDLSVTISDGDRLGVVGINGSGKTTLLRMLARELEPGPDSGVVRWGRGVRVGVLEQVPRLPDGTVANAVDRGWQGEAMLERLGMGDMAEAPTSELSGGQAKRVALARLLAADHDALILDEPTNHLDLDAIAFLEQWLASFRGGLVMVTHDRHVLDAVTNRVLELDRGVGYLHVPSNRSMSLPAGSGYAAYLDGRSERESRAEAAEQVRRNLARTELAWLRRGAPARTSKPKARIASATALVEGRAEAAARAGELSLSLGSQRLGSKGVELRDVGFAWPDGTPVLRSVSMQLEPGDRVGIVGPNGVGKSTLLDLVAGRLAPTAGTIERGATVQVGYYDQLGRDLDLGQRVREAIAGNKGEPSLADVTLMRRFWFDGDAQFAPIGTLSGGERRRLQLLLTLVEQPNLLLLDEPTNDLDLDTLRALEDMLDDWPGIAVVVSHDRAFLDRTIDDLIALDPDGRIRPVRGGVSAWLAKRAEAAAVSGSRKAPAGAGAGTAGRSSSLPSRTPAASGRSPSTLRRLLTKAERDVAAATAARDGLLSNLATPSDHREIERLGKALAAAEADLHRLEESWLELAAEAEANGLT